MARLFAANLKGPGEMGIWVGNGKDLVRNSSLCRHYFESKRYRRQGNVKKDRPMIIFSDHRRTAYLVVRYPSFTLRRYNQVQPVLHVLSRNIKSLYFRHRVSRHANNS